MGNPFHGPALQDPQPHTVILERLCPEGLYLRREEGYSETISTID